jgi:hypothetical protein
MTNWKAQKFYTDYGVSFVAIKKLSKNEWAWEYSDHVTVTGMDHIETIRARGTMFKTANSTLYKIERDLQIFTGKTIANTVLKCVDHIKETRKIIQTN